jgi:hypothetical protein
VQITEEYVRRSLPSGPPPLAFVPPRVIAAASLLRKDVLRRSLLWTAAIFEELYGLKAIGSLSQRAVLGDRFGALHSELPPDAFSVGLLDPAFEGSGFGIAVRAADGGLREPIRDEIYFPRLERTFPAVAYNAEEDPHVSGPKRASVNPVGGCTACWAQKNGSASRGFVTARHCTNGYALGASIRLAPRGSGIVADKAPGTVDAAYISVSGRRRAGRALLSTVPFPMPGLRVVLNFPSGAREATVKDTTMIHELIDDYLFPVTITTDVFGERGESGSLMTTRGGRGVGIYSGTTILPNGETIGRSQHLEQARLLLNLRLYR